MSKSNYPLDDREYPVAKELKDIAFRLEELLAARGDEYGNGLPGEWEAETSESCGGDGHYVGGLYIAAELIRKAVK